MASVHATSDAMQRLQQSDFSRLKDVVYLDHAGTTQYPSRLPERYAANLSQELYGNPHSSSLSGEKSRGCVEVMRSRLLRYFHTSPDVYSVVFTSGCTGSLKTISDAFFHTTARSSVASDEYCFCYLDDNHTSVLGIRETAADRGASVKCASEEVMQTAIDGGSISTLTGSNTTKDGRLLVAFPAQSNFCGRRYPLSWVQGLHDLGPNCYVLLDAASLVTTAPLNLDSYRPDFVTLSFYKMFGFPTSLGALLIRNESGAVLGKSYFGGGTIKVASAVEPFHILKDNLHERFEDGTVNYLDIIALQHAMDTFCEITTGIEDVSEYTFILAKIMFTYLKGVRHVKGKPVAVLYCDTDFEMPSNQGPVIAFNLLGLDGQYVGYHEVSKLGQVYNIHLRTGCMCNIGDCQRHLSLSPELVREHFHEGHECGDDVDLVDGCPTGAVRISVGYITTLDDVRAFITFIEECFVEGRPPMDASAINQIINEVIDPKPPIAQPSTSSIRLKQIVVYPIKSCGGFSVPSWQLGPRGLLYDREWIVIDDAGLCVTQKNCQQLVHISPSIDLDRGILTLSCPGMEEISLPLEPPSETVNRTVRICGSVARGHRCVQAVSDWISKAVGKKGLHLVRADPTKTRHVKGKPAEGAAASAIAFSNEAQVLLVSEVSVRHFKEYLHERIQGNNEHPLSDASVDQLRARFRANLLVSGPLSPQEEETWFKVSIGASTFVVQGACQRCALICTDQETGARNKDIFRALSNMTDRRATFGILMNQVDSALPGIISVGDVVVVVD